MVGESSVVRRVKKEVTIMVKARGIIDVSGKVTNAVNVERCSVNLIEETTNTKHTHQWSKAL